MCFEGMQEVDLGRAACRAVYPPPPRLQISVSTSKINPEGSHVWSKSICDAPGTPGNFSYLLEPVF